jgi:hypothetical protein
MARSKTSASFTRAEKRESENQSSLFPLAWPFSKASERTLAELATALNVKPATPPAVKAALANPAALRARIARCPVLSLVALEILADYGGEVVLSEVLSELARRTGVSPSAAKEAVKGAYQLLVVVSLSPANADRSSVPDALVKLALIDVCAGPVAACVRGLTLPRPAPPEGAPAAPSRGVRDLIAFVGLTAHRTLKLNQNGWPNRASLKVLVKGTGLSVECAEFMVADALRIGLLSEAEQPRVQAASLLRFASAEPEAADEEAREAWLPRGQWVSLEAMQRALSAIVQTHQQFSIPGWLLGGRHVNHASYWAAIMRLSPWLDVLEHGGATWLRRRADAAAPGAGSGDGYVTPSFEVMLGPAAAGDVVALVALGCELVRVDHMLTFRLGPRSVEAGLAAGMGGEQFLSALARVGPRGVPENVRLMVEDWLQSARLARLETGVIVRVAERFGDAVAGALGQDLVGRISRGVLVVRASPGGPDIGQRLAKLGYRPCSDASAPWSPEPSGAASVSGAVGRTPPPFPPPHAPLMSLWPTPDEALAKRYDAAKASGFADDIRALSHPHPQAPPAGKPSQGPNDDVAEAEGEPRDALARVEAAAALAERLFAACRVELDAWIGLLREEERARARRAFGYPLFWAPLLALLPKYRVRVLSRQRSVDGALLDAWRLCGAARRHREGSALMSLMREALITIDEWDDALNALDYPRSSAVTLTEIFGPPRPSPAASVHVGQDNRLP